MTKTLFIECRDDSGITEVWEPTVEDMSALGWVRREHAMKFAQNCANAGAILLNEARELGVNHAATVDEDEDDDPEPTRYDVPDLDTKTNGHHAAEAELGDCACHSPNVDQSPGGAYFCRGCGRGVGYLNRPAPEAEKLLLTDRLAQLLPERLGKGEGAAMATVAVLIEVLSERLGKVF